MFDMPNVSAKALKNTKKRYIIKKNKQMINNSKESLKLIIWMKNYVILSLVDEIHREPFGTKSSIYNPKTRD